MGGKVSYEKVTLPSDYVAIVTGASAGIGYETAKNLAIMGAKVVLACRNQGKTIQAIEKMRQEIEQVRQENTTGLQLPEELQLHYMHLDLASLESTKKFIEEFKATGWPLHLLVCNAGMAWDKQVMTEDNHETMFQVNYLSHYLIVEHLLPIMQSSGEDCRILLVSSGIYKMCKFKKDDIEGTKKAKTSGVLLKLYSNSKCYQVMHMTKLYSQLQQRNIQNIGVFSIHPGSVLTEFSRDLSPSMQSCIRFTYKLGFTKNPVKGAFTSLNCAVKPDLKGKSGYYENCKQVTVSGDARDEENHEILDVYTRECLKDYLT
ncbi:unnamed protein product [Owenia fusiformis]|uniref:Uncharacterized protein n=1 Tax=Owenia fusiformis TaxID=6347 RepID=A0A8J1U0F4_OWEFU|nr:unnamed protein product [Owenia fusiformis]